MTQNMKLIWTNRALNVFAAISWIVSVVVGMVAALGDVVRTLRDAGVVPTKYLAIASLLAAAGTAAAKYSKTPSQAIAAAVPPAQDPKPPVGPPGS